MSDSKVSQLNELESSAVQRLAEHLKSARNRKAFQAALSAGDVTTTYEVVLGEDEELMYELLDDDGDAVDAFIVGIIKSSQVKKSSK